MARSELPPTQLTGSQPPPSGGVEEKVHAALEAVVYDSLSPVLAGLGVLFAIFAVSHRLLLRPSSAAIMSPLAAGTAIAALGLRAALGRWRLPGRLVHPVGMAILGVVLLNSLLHMYLESDPLQTTNVLLLIVGIGFLFLSTPWLMAAIAAAWLGWEACVQLLPAAPSVEDFNWVHFQFALLSATLLSIIVHTVRVRTLQRLERLRLAGEAQQHELKVALALAEETRQALETSIAVGQQLTSILELNTLLNQVAELIKERYGYYYVGIFLLNEGENCLEVCAGTGQAGQALLERGFRLELGEGIIGWVAEQGRLARVDDVTQDRRYKRLDVMPDTRSELALPMEARQKTIGVLDIQSDRLAAFGDRDVALLQSLAAQVAIAIRNASLYESEKSRRKVAEMLQGVSRAISGSLDLSTVLHLILDNLAEIVPYDRGSVQLPSGDRMSFAAARGFPDPAQLARLTISIKENDIFQQIYATRQPLHIPNVASRPDWQHVEGLPRAQAWLGVPLIRSGEVIGMLSLTRETADTYTPDEIELATTFAGPAAIALENAQLYDNLSRAYEQLERLDRTKSDFIAVVSHELRTPLTVLRGSSQMLLDNPLIRDNLFLQELVSTIHSGTLRLHEIVNAMLDIVKIDSRALQLHAEPVSVAALVHVLKSSFQDVLLERQLAIAIDIPDDLPAIEADPEALKKAFYHLIVNAIKYTPDGGHISVSGRPLPAGHADVRQGGIEIVVSDTGIGVAPEAHELIFTKFYQTGEVALHSSGKTKFKGGGAGLGLAIVRGIVEAHGGKVWVDSPGHDEETCPGSHFHVILPLQQAGRPDGQAVPIA